MSTRRVADRQIRAAASQATPTLEVRQGASWERKVGVPSLSPPPALTPEQRAELEDIKVCLRALRPRPEHGPPPQLPYWETLGIESLNESFIKRQIESARSPVKRGLIVAGGLAALFGTVVFGGPEVFALIQEGHGLTLLWASVVAMVVVGVPLALTVRGSQNERGRIYADLWDLAQKVHSEAGGGGYAVPPPD